MKLDKEQAIVLRVFGPLITEAVIVLYRRHRTVTLSSGYDVVLYHTVPAIIDYRTVG